MMRWGKLRGKKPPITEEMWEAYRDTLKPNKAEQLAARNSDLERAELCTRWAAQAREDYYRGYRESVQDMLLSRDPRYKHWGPAERAATGGRKWGSTIKAKELAGIEQMYSRWASEYAMQATAQASRIHHD